LSIKLPKNSYPKINIGLIIIVWSVFYAYGYPKHWEAIQHYWKISVTMIFGSIIAGATSEGGGAIAFPIFTKILKIPPQDAKIFSLAIQSLGMSAATITILSMKIPILWKAIFWTSIGGILGLSIGLHIAHFISPEFIRMLFTMMAISLAINLAFLQTDFQKSYHTITNITAKEASIFIVTGITGGLLSGLVGSGIDMVCFTVLVLLFRVNVTIATPTSVVLMAIHSFFGILIQVFTLEGINSQVQDYWFAAAPVVIIGAPLGAFLCTKMKNQHIRYLLISLISLEMCSSLWLLKFDISLIMFSSVLLIFFSSLMFYMYKSNTYA